MTLTLVWVGSDRDGNATPPPAGWAPGPYETDWQASVDNVLEVEGVTVYVLGTKRSVRGGVFTCAVFVAPIREAKP